MPGGVKVGTGYIDIRLGDLKQFFGKLKSEVEKGGRGVGEQLGRKVGERFQLDKRVFSKITEAVKDEANRGGGEFQRIMRKKFLEAGGQGADAVIEQFRPQFRRFIERSGIEGKDELLKHFDAGTLGKKMSRDLVDAFGQGLDVTLPDRAGRAGQRAGGRLGSGAAQGARSGAGAFGSLGKAIDRVGQRVGLLGFQISNLGYTASAVISGPIALLTGAAAAIGVKTAASIEDAQVAFETLLGSQPKAAKFLRTLRDFANVSPVFDIDNVVEFARKMLGAGISVKQVIPAMTALSSIAATYGLNQDQISRALLGFTQSLLKGRVLQEELNQVNEAGIPIFDLLAQSMGKSRQEIQKMLDAKTLKPDDLIAAIIKIGNSGKFLSGLEKRTNTLSGTWAQFKETLSSRLADALLPQLPKIKRFLKDLGDAIDTFLKNSGPFFDKLTSKFEDLGKSIKNLADAYDNLNPKQKDAINNLLVVGTAIGPAIVAVGAFATAIGGVVSALGFLFTPAGLMVGALAGLAAAAIYAYKHSKEFRDFVNAAGRDIQAAARIIGDAWSEKVVPAFRAVADVWNTSLKPALSELYAKIKDDIGPAAKALAVVVGTILALALQFLALVITNIVVPALKLVADFARQHPLIFRAIAVAVLALVAAFILVTTIVLALVVVALGILAAAVAFVALAIGLVIAAVIKVIGWIGRLVDFIASRAPQAKRAVKEIGDAFGQLPGAVANAVGQVIAVFGQLPGALIDIGQSAVRGLVRGALGQIGSVVNAAKTLASAFLGAIGGAFKIGSPSRVMMDVGRDVVAGFLIGLDSMPTSVAVGTVASFTGNGEIRIDPPTAPLSPADLRSAIEGLRVVLDDNVVGRVQGRRSGLYSRAEY